MPKEKKPARVRATEYAKEYSFYRADGPTLFCKLCSTSVCHDTRTQVTQHIATQKHKLNATKKSNGGNFSVQQPLVLQNDRSGYFSDLTEAFTKANIPLNKINDENIARFLEKYTGCKSPDESTLRKNYLPKIYEEKQRKLKERLHNQKVWTSVDETTDTDGRYVANCIIDLFDMERTSFLANTTFLERTDHSTIAKFFFDTLRILGIDFDNVLVLVTDAAPYMSKAAVGIKILIPKLIHIFCLAHNLHRVCEKIRSKYDDVNELIAMGKKVFEKAPYRRKLLFDNGLALPPEPIVTRWGTWLSACEYYVRHFETFKTTVKQLENKGVTVSRLKTIVETSSVVSSLATIASKYTCLVELIQQCEARRTNNSDLISQIREASNEFEPDVKAKLDNVLAKNTGLTELLTPDHAVYSVQEIALLLNAPLNSAEVERSFSKYKHLLTDLRRRMTEENIKIHLFVQMNLL